MYGIEWSKIKNGAVGFENLAREYVKDQYEFFHGKWEKTPQTHDGNKDAYTIIIGFNPDLIDDEVWWMEAKYSNGKKNSLPYLLCARAWGKATNRSST